MKRLNCLLALALVCVLFLLGCGGGGGGGGGGAANPVGPVVTADPVATQTTPIATQTTPVVPSTWLQTSETGVYLEPYADTGFGILELAVEPSTGNVHAFIANKVYKIVGGVPQLVVNFTTQSDSVIPDGTDALNAVTNGGMRDIAFYKGELVIVNSTSHRVYRVSGGKIYSLLTSADSLDFSDLTENDAAGNLFVSSSGNHKTVILAPSGAKSEWDNAALNGVGPAEMHLDAASDTLYYMDNEVGGGCVSRVYTANKTTGSKTELFRFDETQTGTLLNNLTGTVSVHQIQAFARSIVPWNDGYLVACSNGVAFVKNGQCKRFMNSSDTSEHSVVRDSAGNIYIGVHGGKVYKVKTL